MKTPKQILQDDNAPFLALLWLVIKTYGEECFSWSPAVLRIELQEDFNCDVSELQSDRIQSAIIVLHTDMVETDLLVFENACHLINGQHDELAELNPLEPEELVCGLTEIYLIRSEVLHFSDDICVYAGRIFHEYGLHAAPELFPKAIMPKTHAGDDEEKNKAIRELFDAKVKHVEAYLRACTS